jgi:hypothetical protein
MLSAVVKVGLGKFVPSNIDHRAVNPEAVGVQFVRFPGLEPLRYGLIWPAGLGPPGANPGADGLPAYNPRASPPGAAAF